MGYILPVRLIQSEQYAMRLNLKPYNFANVERVQPVKLGSDFLEEFNESLQSKYAHEEKKEEARSSVIPFPYLNKGYIQPNPVNLSPAISKVVGKGININAYI